MKFPAVFVTFFCLLSCATTRTTQLQGEYRHAIKNEFYSILTFHGDDFTLIEVGDLGRFFGKGKFSTNSNTLVLTFDTLNLDKTKTHAYTIIEPKVDSLNVSRMGQKELEVRHVMENGTYYAQRYIKR